MNVIHIYLYFLRKFSRTKLTSKRVVCVLDSDLTSSINIAALFKLWMMNILSKEMLQVSQG